MLLSFTRVVVTTKCFQFAFQFIVTEADFWAIGITHTHTHIYFACLFCKDFFVMVKFKHLPKCMSFAISICVASLVYISISEFWQTFFILIVPRSFDIRHLWFWPHFCALFFVQIKFLLTNEIIFFCDNAICLFTLSRYKDVLQYFCLGRLHFYGRKCNWLWSTLSHTYISIWECTNCTYDSILWVLLLLLLRFFFLGLVEFIPWINIALTHCYGCSVFIKLKFIFIFGLSFELW